jgi:hypothetical protein
MLSNSGMPAEVWIAPGSLCAMTASAEPGLNRTAVRCHSLLAFYCYCWIRH